jgi:hypothetical protein
MCVQVDGQSGFNRHSIGMLMHLKYSLHVLFTVVQCTAKEVESTALNVNVYFPYAEFMYN